MIIITPIRRVAAAAVMAIAAWQLPPAPSAAQPVTPSPAPASRSNWILECDGLRCGVPHRYWR